MHAQQFLFLQYINCIQSIETIKDRLSMNREDQNRRKTRSRQNEEQRSNSHLQIPSQNYLQPHDRQDDPQSSKHKEIKAHNTSNVRKSNWSKKQRVKYLVFANYYSQLSNWNSDLKSIPTYKSLSLFVKSRSPEQCKSFHLSMRRNFKTMDELIKSLQQELQQQEGYQKLLDRYDFEILSFQEQHNILRSFELKEKKYFRDKLFQKIKQTQGAEAHIEEQPQDSPIAEPNAQNPNNQAQCNFKFNVKDLIGNEQAEEAKNNKRQYEKVGNLKNTQQKSEEQEQFIQKQQQSFFKSPLGQMANINYPTQGNQTLSKQPFNTNQSNINFFIPNQANYPQFPFPNQMVSNKGNQLNASIQQGINSSYSTDKRMENQNQRMMQQNLKRMMELNKNSYNPFSGYPGYAQGPFPNMNNMNRMTMPNQFPMQMQFSMPPPGGISYLFNPYMYQNLQNTNLQNPSGQSTNFQNQNKFPHQMLSQNSNIKKQSERQNEGIMQNVPSAKAGLNNIQADNSSNYLNELKMQQKRKQLLLNCHKHWVNWMRGVQQLNRRKQSHLSVLNNQ